MRPIDGDKLKHKVQRIATEAWMMKLTASVETTLNQFIDYIDEAPSVVPQVPSEDCISREWLLSNIEQGEKEAGGIIDTDTDNMKNFIRVAPSVVPTERTGEWLPIIEGNEFGEAYQAGIYCSECGETLGCEANYCPNCGAKMKGADE